MEVWYVEEVSVGEADLLEAGTAGGQAVYTLRTEPLAQHHTNYKSN